MPLGRIGGWLVTAGAIALAGKVVGSGLGSPTADVGSGPGWLLLAGGLIAVGIGLAAIAAAGGPPFHDRAVRVTLGAMGIGMVAMTLGAPASMSEPTVLLLLVGGAFAWLGGLVAVLLFLRAGGALRLVGGLFVVGALLAGIGPAIGFDADLGTTDPSVAGLGAVVALIGTLLEVAAVVRLGWLAARPGSAAPASSPAVTLEGSTR